MFYNFTYLFVLVLFGLCVSNFHYFLFEYVVVMNINIQFSDCCNDCFIRSSKRNKRKQTGLKPNQNASQTQLRF